MKESENEKIMRIVRLVNKHACPNCGKRLHGEGNLRRHIRTIHKNAN